MKNRDLKKVIAGMAKLGEIYLRIEGRIRAFYNADPMLMFEANAVLAKAGYIPQHENMDSLIAQILSKDGIKPLGIGERIFLRHYAKMFYDPVLIQEVVMEYAHKDPEEREKMKTALDEQLSIFPDPNLGQLDLELCRQRHQLGGTALRQ